eukprot:350747-Chlamydomonas_euryale.AAC.14
MVTRREPSKAFYSAEHMQCSTAQKTECGRITLGSPDAASDIASFETPQLPAHARCKSDPRMDADASPDDTGKRPSDQQSDVVQPLPYIAFNPTAVHSPVPEPPARQLQHPEQPRSAFYAAAQSASAEEPGRLPPAVPGAALALSTMDGLTLGSSLRAGPRIGSGGGATRVPVPPPARAASQAARP